MRSLLRGLHSVILIADGSQSAAKQWPLIRQTAARLLAALPPDAAPRIYLLGGGQSYPAAIFNDARPPANGVSLIAPIIQQMRQARRYAELAVIIGAGPIFDLEDWLAFPWIERWLLVKAGGDSLCPPGAAAAEIEAANLLDAAWPAPYAPPAAPPAEAISVLSDAAYQWRVDETGFPLLRIPPLQAYWPLFPLTKCQLEAYLCAAAPGYGDDWYGTLLAVNGRLSFRHAPWEMYEGLFAGGLLPDEAEAAAQWLGGNLPGVEAWRAAYRWLATQPPLLPPGRLEGQLAPAARAIWYGLYGLLRPSSLLDLSLMRGGLCEWVRDGRHYRLLGKPRPAFHEALLDPLRDAPIRPIEPVRRVGHYGVRAMY